MKSPSSGLTIPWKDFRRALREEVIFHASHCPAKKDTCLEAWLDQWWYCDNYVLAKHIRRELFTESGTSFTSTPNLRK